MAMAVASAAVAAGKRTGGKESPSLRDRSDSDASDATAASRSSERTHAEIEELFLRGRAQPEDYSGVALDFVEFGEQLYLRVTSTPSFELFFQIAIGLMSFLMGLETYEYFKDGLVIGTLMLILVVLFSLEVILKMLAESVKPWRYFMGPRYAPTRPPMHLCLLTHLPLALVLQWRLEHS